MYNTIKCTFKMVLARAENHTLSCPLYKDEWCTEAISNTCDSGLHQSETVPTPFIQWYINLCFFFWFLSIFKRSFRSFAQDASVWHIRYADDVLFLGLCKPRFSCIPLFSWFISCNIIYQTCISVVFSLWSFMYATMCQSNLMQEISGSCVTRHESKLNL